MGIAPMAWSAHAWPWIVAFVSVNHQASQILTRGGGAGASGKWWSYYCGCPMHITLVHFSTNPCTFRYFLWNRSRNGHDITECDSDLRGFSLTTIHNPSVWSTVCSTRPSTRRFLDATVLRHGLRAPGAQLRVAVAPWSQPHGTAAVGGSRGASGPEEAPGLAGLGPGRRQRHLGLKSWKILYALDFKSLEVTLQKLGWLFWWFMCLIGLLLFVSLLRFLFAVLALAPSRGSPFGCSIAGGPWRDFRGLSPGGWDVAAHLAAGYFQGDPRPPGAHRGPGVDRWVRSAGWRSGSMATTSRVQQTFYYWAGRWLSIVPIHWSVSRWGPNDNCGGALSHHSVPGWML